MTHPSGNLFVIAAPSGAGKTSLVKALSESLTQFQISVSHTTRSKRPGEVDGENYFFIDDAAFDSMIEKQAFLEHATVFGNHYGTSYSWVHDHLREGTDVVLEIDWQGARQIKTLHPRAILVFILPPSIEALKLRLQSRQQDDTYTIERRMNEAQAEMSHYHEFDYLVINDLFDVALRDLQHIVLASRLKMDVQTQKKSALLDNLLKKK
ncbi:MAG: guanylate kinase [Gammaproteobacteria bacterium]|nr:guanylate kinase [Gammaproteobacteria bacterium]